MNTDDRLDKALDHANYVSSLTNQLKAAWLKTETKLNYAVNGGIFPITMELISFVDCLIRAGHTETILFDNKNRPIKIQNLPDFYAEIMSLYHETANGYYNDYENVRKSRNVAKVVGL